MSQLLSQDEAEIHTPASTSSSFFRGPNETEKELDAARKELRESFEANRLLSERVSSLQNELDRCMSLASSESQLEGTASPPLLPPPPSFASSQVDSQDHENVGGATIQSASDAEQLRNQKEQLTREFLESSESCRQRISSFFLVAESVTSVLATSSSMVSSLSLDQTVFLGILERLSQRLHQRATTTTTTMTSSAEPPPLQMPPPSFEARTRLVLLIEELKEAHALVQARVQAAEEGERGLLRFRNWLSFAAQGDSQAHLVAFPSPEGLLEKLEEEGRENAKLTQQLQQLEGALRSSEGKNGELEKQLEDVSLRMDTFCQFLREKATLIREGRGGGSTAPGPVQAEQEQGGEKVAAQPELSTQLPGDLEIQVSAVEAEMEMAVEVAAKLAFDVSLKTQQIGTLGSELAASEERYSAQASQLKEVESEAADLKSLLDYSMNELSESTSKWEAVFQAKSKEIEETQHQVRAKEAEVAALQLETEELSSKLKEQAGLLQENYQTLAKAKAAEEELTSELQLEAKRSDVFHKKLLQLTQDHQILEEDRNALFAALSTLQEASAEKETRLDAIVAENQTLTTQLQEQQQLGAQIKSQNGTLTHALAALNVRLGESESKWLGENLALEAQRSSLSRTVDKLQADGDAQRTAFLALEQQLVAHKEKLEEQGKELAALVAREEALKESMVQAQQQVDQLRVELEKERQEGVARQAALEEKDSSYFVMSLTLQEKEDEFREMVAESKQDKEKIALLQEQAEQAGRTVLEKEAMAADLRQSLQTKTTEAENMAARIVQLETDLSVSGSSLRVMTEERMASVTQARELTEALNAAGAEKHRLLAQIKDSKDFETQLVLLRGENEGKELALDQLKGKMESTVQEMAEQVVLSKKKAVQLEADLAAAKEQLQAFSKQLSHTRTKLEETGKAQKEGAEREATSLREIKSLEDDKARLVEELRQAKLVSENSLSLVSSLRDEIKKANQRYHEVKGVSERAVADLENSKSTNTRLKKELAEKTEKLGRMEALALGAGEAMKKGPETPSKDRQPQGLAEPTKSQEERVLRRQKEPEKEIPRDSVDPQEESPSQKKRRARLPLYSPSKRVKEGGSDANSLVGSQTASNAPRKKKGPVVVAFSGFKQGLAEFNLETKVAMEQIVIKLGGKVKNEGEFDSSITHVVSPPNSRTVKTLAAVLTNRWLVYPKWILDSLAEGTFVDEEGYGIHSSESPFKGKKFFLSESFLRENEKKESKLQNCKSLIVLFGKGDIVKDVTISDMVVRGATDSSHFPCPSVDWEGFIDLIPGGGKLK